MTTSLITSDWQSRRAEILTMTPAMAEEALTSGNVNNRKYKKSLGKRMQKDMVDGNFLFTGESIIFSYNPVTGEHTLEDGHNRCANALATGTTFETVVVFGINPKASSRMDSGADRTRTDVLEMNKIPNFAIISAALPFVTGYLGMAELDNHSFLSIVKDSALATPLQGGASVSLTVSGIPQNLVTALYVLGIGVNRNATEEFFIGLGNMVGLQAGDPRLALRTWINNALLSPVGRRPSRRSFFTAGIKALRAFFEGTTLDSIKLKPSDVQKKNRQPRLTASEEQADLTKAKLLLEQKRKVRNLKQAAARSKKIAAKVAAATAEIEAAPCYTYPAQSEIAQEASV